MRWVVLFVVVFVAAVELVLLVQTGVGLVAVKGTVVILRVQGDFLLRGEALVRVQSGLLTPVGLVPPVLVLVLVLVLPTVVLVLTILIFLGEALLVQ